jgi:serpin B
LLACFLILPACDSSSPKPSAAEANAAASSQGGKDQTAYAPLVLDAKFHSLMDGLLAGGAANSCVSPLSFKLALAMAYNGAEGGASGLLSELFGVSKSELNSWAAEYLLNAKQYDGSRSDEYSPPSPELRIANSYWLREGLESEISQDFTDALSASFSAQSGKFDKSPDTINKWASDATNGKIKGILADIAPSALSYLVNALYFNAQWASDFSESRTAPGEFANFGGGKAMVDMLHGGADSYINTERFEGVSKRLFGGFEFAAVMPKTGEAVTLDAMLKAERDNSYTAILLTLPKFGFDTSVGFKEGSHPQFDALFAHHGMDGALSENAKTDDLLISEIIQKTTFTLAEAGIEASAATAVTYATGAAPMEEKEVEVVFNKPFYFTLTDMNGEALFVGKVMSL